MSDQGESLRRAMRHWVTGVTIVTSAFGGERHGMTVNSLASVSLEPPVVLVSLAKTTHTYALAARSGVVGITILSSSQAVLSDRFAGRGADDRDRFLGLDVFSLVSGVPFIRGGLAFLDCRVRKMVELDHSTVFLLDVVEARQAEGEHPLIYFNRVYHRLDDELSSTDS